MKKLVSYILVMSMGLSVPLISHAEMISTEAAIKSSEKQSDENECKDESKAEYTKEELKELEEGELEIKRQSLLDRLDVFAPKPGGWIRKQWDKLKIKLDGNFLEKSWPMGENKNIGLGLYWQFIVQPAFIKDYQQRLDIYSTNPSLGWSLQNGFGVGANVGGQVTFSRLFKNKWDAIKGQTKCSAKRKDLLGRMGIYFLNRIPFNPEDLWQPGKPENSYDLQSGDAVRIEYSSSGSGAWGEEDLGGFFKSNVSFSASRSSALIVDIYKLKGSHVRLRLVGTRNTASFGSSLGLALLKQVFSGSYMFIVKWFIEKWLQIKPLSLSFSMVPFEKYPVNTFMADYVFDLSKPEGAEAYRKIMAKIKNPANYLSDFNFFSSQAKIGSAMEKYIAPAEDLFARDRDRETTDRAVDRLFKARAASTNLSYSAESEFTKLFTGRIGGHIAHTNISAFESDNSSRHYTYVSSNSNIKHTRMKVNGFEFNESINGLFEADRVVNENTVVYKPKLLQDFILTNDFENKNLERQDILNFKNTLDRSIPAIAKLIDWHGLTDIKDSTNGYIRTLFVVHENALPYLARYTYQELRSRLSDYIWNHPNRLHYENLANTSSSPFKSDSPYHNMENMITELAMLMDTVLHNPKPEERFIAFKTLKNDEVFQEISMGFITSLLPEDELNELVYFNLVAGGRDINNMPPFTFGKNGVSDFYKAMQYILSLINDRSFDLRVQMNERGDLSVHRSQNVCATCDDLTRPVRTTPASN